MIMIVSHRCLMSNASFTNKSDMSGNTVTILHAGKPSPLTEEKEKKIICILHYSSVNYFEIKLTIGSKYFNFHFSAILTFGVIILT